MNPDSVTDVPGRIVLRGYQFRSLLWAAGGGVFLGLALFALVSDQPAIGALVFIAVAGVCCGIFLEAAVFNVLTVTDDQVDHRWWLGLRHKTVAIDSVRRIGSRIPPGRSAPSMRM